MSTKVSSIIHSLTQMSAKVVAFYAMCGYCGGKNIIHGESHSYTFEDCVNNFVSYFISEEDCQFESTDDLEAILEGICEANYDWDENEDELRREIKDVLEKHDSLETDSEDEDEE